MTSKKAKYDVDIYTIIFLALAVFIFLRLRSVLGQRTGHERPPFERWYRKTWIRNDDSPYNLHRSYERTLAFLAAHYLTP